MALGLCYNECVDKEEGIVISTIPCCKKFAMQ